MMLGVERKGVGNIFKALSGNSTLTSISFNNIQGNSKSKMSSYHVILVTLIGSD